MAYCRVVSSVSMRLGKTEEVGHPRLSLGERVIFFHDHQQLGHARGGNAGRSTPKTEADDADDCQRDCQPAKRSASGRIAKSSHWASPLLPGVSLGWGGEVLETLSWSRMSSTGTAVSGVSCTTGRTRTRSGYVLDVPDRRSIHESVGGDFKHTAPA